MLLSLLFAFFNAIGLFDQKIAIFCSQVTFWLANSFASGLSNYSKYARHSKLNTNIKVYEPFNRICNCEKWKVSLLIPSRRKLNFIPHVHFFFLSPGTWAHSPSLISASFSKSPKNEWAPVDDWLLLGSVEKVNILVCIQSKWPIRAELLPDSVKWSENEYFYSPLDGMLVHRRVI